MPTHGQRGLGPGDRDPREALARSDAGALRVTGLAQVSLSVTDLARSVAFYTDVLGLPLAYPVEGPVAFVVAGETSIMLATPNAGARPSSSVLYLRVDDIDGAYRTMVARDVTTRGAPHRIHRDPTGAETWLAFFEDPDGNLLSFYSLLEPATPGCAQ